MSLRERKKEQVHQSILAAAADLICETGDANFSVKDLAEAAQVSTVTVHNYFGTKGEVCSKLLNGLLQETRDKLLASETGGEPVERLYSMVDLVCKSLIENAVIYRALSGSSFGALESTGEPLLQRTTQSWRVALLGEGNLEKVRSILKPEIDIDFAATQFAIAMRGVFTAWVNSELDNEAAILHAKGAVTIVLLAICTDSLRSRLTEELMSIEERIRANHAAASVR